MATPAGAVSELPPINAKAYVVAGKSKCDFVNGRGTESAFNFPNGIGYWYDREDKRDCLLITDRENGVIRKMTCDTYDVSTFVPDKFRHPAAVYWHQPSDSVYVGDESRVYKIDRDPNGRRMMLLVEQSGWHDLLLLPDLWKLITSYCAIMSSTVIVGSEDDVRFVGIGVVDFTAPFGFVCAADGQSLICCEYDSSFIRRIDLATNTATTIQFTNKSHESLLDSPCGIAFASHSDEKIIYFGGRSAIVRWDTRTDVLEEVCKTATSCLGLVVLDDGRVITRDSHNRDDSNRYLIVIDPIAKTKRRIDTGSFRFSNPFGLALTRSALWVSDNGNMTISKVELPPELLPAPAAAGSNSK